MALVLHYKLQDDAASTTVVADVGSNGTLNGGNTADKTTTGPGTALTKAFDLDGTDDQVDCGNQGDITGPLTICAWVNPDTVAPTFQHIAGRRNGAGFQYQLRINLNDFSFLPTTGGAVTSPGAEVATGVWQHIAAVLDGSGNVTLYKDGASIGTGGSRSITTVATNFRIGIESGGTQDLDGKIADVRLYDSDESANLAAIMAEKDASGGATPKGPFSNPFAGPFGGPI